MRRSICILTVLGVSLSCLASVHAASPTQYQKAYDYALRCFIVTSLGEAPNSGRTAYDGAIKLAHLQGLSDQQIMDDYHLTLAEEAIKINRSPQYKQQLIEECQKIGLAD
jgi:hypothetical protein